ncbi:MAG: hypothetical protein U0Z53_23670 [Blastocatellia bacterium]
MAVSAPVMDARFVFADDLPLAVQGELHKHLPALGWALPAWVQRVTLYWSLADDGETASIEVSYEYRWAAVYLTSKWLQRGCEEQREDLLHELLHISLGPLFNYARDTIRLLLDDAPKFQKHAENELRIRHELATQELTGLLKHFCLPQ